MSWDNEDEQREELTPEERAARRAEIRRQLYGPDSFVPVLILAIGSVLAFPVGDKYRWGGLVTFPLLAGAILLGFHRAKVRPRTFRYATIVIAFVLVAGLVTESVSKTSESRWGSAVVSFLLITLLLIALPAITRRALGHRVVTLNTLAAAVTAYILIGILFANLFRLISALEGVPFFVQLPNPHLGEYQYFSFITLTTVGYGDLTAATDAGRDAAMLEAIVGQVFLVTAVARIVSLLGQERMRPTRRPQPYPEPSLADDSASHDHEN